MGYITPRALAHRRPCAPPCPLYALAATAAGLDRDGAVAVAFLISLIQYIPVTSIGLALASSLTWRDESRTAATALRRNDLATSRTGGNRNRPT